jgi:F0F1-type ATP synthase epsilon subunit
MPLSLEIVSGRGIDFSAEQIERIVVRRREERFRPGSEIAICPHHAPLLMQIQHCQMRITRDGRTTEREVAAGVLEVFEDHVTLAVT